jgi:dihydrofolate reductase
VAKVRFKIAMSLDGYAAGPQQSKENPLGIGGTLLHAWVYPLAAWRTLHGLEGGEVNESTRVVEESMANIGATIMGRNMFGGHPGPWDAVEPWSGTTFTFVTDGIAAALEPVRRAARGLDVSLAGGASTAQQYLSAGLVDEMEIHLVPMLLGAEERLFEGVRDLGGLQLVRTVAAPNVAHLKFVRR